MAFRLQSAASVLNEKNGEGGERDGGDAVRVEEPVEERSEQ